MNHMAAAWYGAPLRPTQGSYYPRTTGPPSQAQRMENHNNRLQQPLFYSPVQNVNVPLTHMYITPNSIPPYPANNFATQRPPGFVQSLHHQLYYPPISAFNPYATTPSQTPQVPSESKQNSQRSASKQQQAAMQNNNYKQADPEVPIPVSQPAKTTGVKIDKNENDQEGADKEGTDMDAVNFYLMTPSNIPVVSNNDIVNANIIPAATETKNNVPQQMPRVDVNVNVDQPTSNNTKSESNEITIKKPLAEILKTNKFSITDIVEEKPKNMKPIVSMVESQDEPYRVGAIPNDRLVQVKNDVNSKTSEINRFYNKLPYKDGQWSPANQSGIKVYQRDFLLALKDLPACKKAPVNIPDVIMAEKRGELH